jgi:Carboxypeptidase regulatory-like domain/TonB-dependent Receptor Plug Domain
LNGPRPIQGQARLRIAGGHLKTTHTEENDMSTMRRFVSRSLLFPLALLFITPALYAQLSTRATITGTVTDGTGAVVPGAKVTITDDATKVATVTETNGSGSYNISGLTVSTYSIGIVKTGFKSYVVTGVELHPTETVQVNGALAVGASTETVTVGATSSDVELSTPENSAYVSGEQVSSLPMNGRNYSAVLAGLPGVQNLSNGSALTTGGRSTNDSLSINGMATSRSFYAVDGIWNENTGNMTQQSVIPNPDSIEEVRVLQNNFSSQYSLLGSSVIMVQTKSGTGSLHGRAWEFVRNDDINAKNYYQPNVLPYKQNIFGFNVGGPVFIPHFYNSNRQKTFFFWDESYVVLHVPGTTSPSQLPIPNQIAGCFTSPIKDPVAGTLFPTVSTCNGATGTFYQIPAASINKSSQAYLQTLYPVPNYTPVGSTLNYIDLQSNTTYQRDDQIKIDHYITPSYHLLAEYFQEYQKFAQNSVSNGTTPISSETDFTNNKLAAVSLTQTLTPNMVNTTNIAMNIFLLNLTTVGTVDISQIPNFSETLFYPNANFSSRTPVVNLAGSLAGQGINGRPIPHASDLDDTVGDNWSWLKGKHYLTAGVTFVFNTKRQQSIFATNGSFTFSGTSSAPTAAQKTATGTCASGAVATQCTQDDGVADMLLGYISSYSQTSFEPHGDIHDFSWSPYVEDRFQFNKNLTLTLGLRVYHLPLPYGVPNSETNFVPSAFNPALAPTVNEFSGVTNVPTGTAYSNGLLFNSGAAGGLPVNFSNDHIWYFAPDAGFAWNVFGDGKTSLRGGYGESYTRIFTNQDCSFSCDANPPVFTNEALSNLKFPSTTSWNIAGAGGTAAATTSASSLTAMDPNIGASPVASWSLGVQHQFPANLVASIVGAGSRIQHLVATWNINQPMPTVVGGVSYDFNPLLNSNPANANKPDNSAYWAPYQGYGAINRLSTQLWGEWNALEVQVKHTMGKGLNVTGSYTYSHDTTNLGSIDPYDLHRYHGNAESMNYPHSLSITAIYTLPFFLRSGNLLEKEVLGGWTFDNIASFRSGTSLTPGLSETNSGLALRPDQVPGTSTNGKKTWKNNVAPNQQWFNTSAFSCPGTTTGVSCGTFTAASYGLYGNAQTGIIRGPGQELFSTSLYKTFSIWEKAQLEIRAEAFNTFNHTNPSNPNTTLGNANYGKITSASDPRFLEFAARLKF